ncbi:MAG: type II toxin-antitoxin system Phd/YefM family antitoxin [Spirochaetes bacterium]|nr:type II toxin-antitoxin system Phd/YefM family antitoxin [Spirochaetota bacterium]
MKHLQVGEFKSRFSSVLDDVRKGEEITISYGKKKEKVAVIVPYSKYKKNIRRKLGILEKRASCVIGDDFSLSDEDMIES